MLSFARTAVDYCDFLKTYQGLLDRIKIIIDYIASKLQAYFELYFLSPLDIVARAVQRLEWRDRC